MTSGNRRRSLGLRPPTPPWQRGMTGNPPTRPHTWLAQMAAPPPAPEDPPLSGAHKCLWPGVYICAPTPNCCSKEKAEPGPRHTSPDWGLSRAACGADMATRPAWAFCQWVPPTHTDTQPLTRRYTHMHTPQTPTCTHTGTHTTLTEAGRTGEDVCACGAGHRVRVLLPHMHLHTEPVHRVPGS